MTVVTGTGDESAGGGSRGGGRRVRGYAAIPPWGDADPIDPPPEIQRRYGVRVLDPSTALRRSGQPGVRSTPYIADRLLAPASVVANDDLLRVLNDAAAESGHGVQPDEAARRRSQWLVENQVADVPVPLRIVPVTEGPTRPPDAWDVLQRARAASADLEAVSLDHLMAAVRPPSMMHSIVDPGAPGAPAGTGYVPGGRTRMPVTLPIAGLPRAPERTLPGRRPVVAVLDTGCGAHPWLPDGVVTRGAELDGAPIGRDPKEPDPESTGDVVGPLDGALDWVAGHGTFIAGVVRQVCPDADVLSVPVVHADGVVLESELSQALAELLVLAARHVRGQDGGLPVDVLSLSIGYYHENSDGPAADAALREVIDGFGRIGVAVVAAAGNESTVRPVIPAAFAPHGATKPEPGVVPVTSVGALNPDGSVALFSNSGDWVTAWAPGALLVSTLPTTFGTATRAAVAFDKPLPGDPKDAAPRSTVDPEDFGGGFAVWSGTSFAAPWVAALIAARLADAGEKLDERDQGVAVKRSWAAVSAVTGVAP